VAGTDAKQRVDRETGPNQRRSRWWIAVLTFVVGVGVGVLAVGLLDTSRPDFQPSSESAPPTTQPTGVQSVPVAASAQVNAACLRVINEAQDVSSVLSEVGPAVTTVDLQQLDDIVRRLQSIQPRLERDLSDCRVETAVVNTPSPGPSASPSTSATPSATAVPTR
jgi:hypothetical protein